MITPYKLNFVALHLTGYTTQKIPSLTRPVCSQGKYNTSLFSHDQHESVKEDGKMEISRMIV